MKSQTYTLELLTPCFCAGADQAKAEIRASSIRGQLRWWFRTLGGFKSLASTSLRKQEALLFGSAAGDVGTASKLIIRVGAPQPQSSIKDGQELGHANFSASAYLTFPIQTREKQKKKVGYNGKGVMTEGEFKLMVQWRGDSKHWNDINALISIFSQLGALGFRSRRAMGALFDKEGLVIDLHKAINHFNKPNGITIKTLATATSPKSAVSDLGHWLKGWRAYGPTRNNDAEKKLPGFVTAKADHDHGAAILRHEKSVGSTFRPALGLPIVQFFSSSKQTVNWEFGPKAAKGRFASPVLLRPYQATNGQILPLVIFVNAHTWPDGHTVFLNGQEREVSTELYETMKNDPKLKTFPILS